MGRFNRPPLGVLKQSKTASERPYHKAYESGKGYTSSIQSAGEEAPDRPIIVRNKRYGGEGLTASLGEAEANRHVRYFRERRTQVLEGTRQKPSMHDPIADGPFRAATRYVLYALRREYLQDAQRFTGQHTSRPDGAHGIQMGNGRMLPPRQNRLTMRPEPKSFGSQTEKIA